MSNPIFPLPSLVNLPPLPPSEPCGALAVQPCLAPVPAPPEPSTPPAVPLPEKPVSAAPVRRAVGEVLGERMRFPRSHPGTHSCAITTNSCNRTRKRSIFNHISQHSCCRSKRPSAFPTRSPTIPASKTENGRRRSAKRSSWTKLPEKRVEWRPRSSL